MVDEERVVERQSVTTPPADTTPSVEPVALSERDPSASRRSFRRRSAARQAERRPPDAWWSSSSASSRR